MGFFPQDISNEARVDVALLAMDCANLEMQEKHTIIDFLTPKIVLFCHWEDFFRDKTQIPREIVKVDLPKAKQYFQNTSDTVFLFPGLDSNFHL
jgi:L-ascorbate metabolism protein UlaG (beta-lactamase superfamily)